MANPATQHARKLYGATFDAVSNVLLQRDPMGINFETNIDEYDPEARTILPRLASCRSDEDVLVVVLEEFHRWFGDDIREDQANYPRIAADIWRIWAGR